MEIKYVSCVLLVKDIKVARRFYEEVLGQTVLMDHGPNVGFNGGFALWQRDHAAQIMFGKVYADLGAPGQPEAELYLESAQLDEALSRLQAAGVEFVHPMIEQPWGQRTVRFYDPDRHILEIGEPMHVPILRFLAQGLSAAEIAQRTAMPVEIIQQIAAAVP